MPNLKYCDHAILPKRYVIKTDNIDFCFYNIPAVYNISRGEYKMTMLSCDFQFTQ